jgi:hypothetical protein
MKEQPYDAEKTLQERLAKHPDLLAGDQAGTDSVRAIDKRRCRGEAQGSHHAADRASEGSMRKKRVGVVIRA